jgi:hypothetical protein
MILTYVYGGVINRSFSGLRLSVSLGYLANGNWSLAQIIEVLLYLCWHCVCHSVQPEYLWAEIKISRALLHATEHGYLNIKLTFPAALNIVF